MVKFIGKISRKKVNELYGKARVGILVYQPAENHFEAQPIKMFEFMAAGLPVVASGFQLWQTILEENQCGICVNPSNSQEVQDACLYLVNNPEKGQLMGINGRKAVIEKYNWVNEEVKLINLYESI